jgi:hypothetical protein
LLVATVVPILFSFGRDKTLDIDEDTIQKERKYDSGFMRRWAIFVINKSLPIGAITVVVLICSILLSLRVTVGTDFFEMMGDKIDMVKNAKYVVERLGGLYSYEVMIELPEDGMVKEPEVLESIEDISNEIKSWEMTTDTGSINDVIKELNWVMNNKDDQYHAIPESRELIAQYLLLYEMSGGESTEDLVDYDYRITHISAQVDKVSYTEGFEQKLSNLEIFAEDKFPEGTKVTIVGDIPIFLRLMNMLTDGQIKSVIAAFVVITLMMMLILKSFRVGLLSMIPNIFPVIITMGAMGLLKIPLDFTTIMVAPMIIGIAVDDTVHYFVHFKQEFDEVNSYKDANIMTFQRVGYAIIFTSVILTFGFSIFCISHVRSMFNMGVVSSVGIISALIADLFITPALFVHLKPFGRSIKTEFTEAIADQTD